MQDHASRLDPAHLGNWPLILPAAVVGGGLTNALSANAAERARAIALFIALSTILASGIRGRMVLALLLYSGSSCHRLTRDALEDGRIGRSLLQSDPPSTRSIACQGLDPRSRSASPDLRAGLG